MRLVNSVETTYPETSSLRSQRRSSYHKTSRFIAPTLLVVLIILQLVRITTVFESREDFHLDECWTYGFANSYYDGYVSRLPVSDFDSVADWNIHGVQTQNFDTWESSQVLRDYLTVQEGQGFDYASVIESQRYDLSPPLHSLILYTICSLFLNSFSWWYAYLINIVAFVVTQILLYLCASRLLRSRWLALLSVALYGFSVGALNCFIYLRPYALLTCLTLLFCWLNLRLFDKGFQRCLPSYLILFVVTFAGAYTNVYFLPFAFVMAVGVCIYLLINKKYAAFILYGCSVLAGALLMLALSTSMFASFVDQSSVYNEVYGNLTRILICLSVLWGEGLGICAPGNLTALFAAVIVGVLLTVCAFVFRRLNRQKPHPERYNNAAALHQKTPRRQVSGEAQVRNQKNRTFYGVILGCAVGATFLVIANTVYLAQMGLQVDRYIAFLMPYSAIALLWGINWILKSFSSSARVRTTILAVLVALLIALGNLIVTVQFIFPLKADYEGSIESVTAGADVILVTNYDWSLTYYAERLQNCDEFFALMFWDYNSHSDALAQVGNDKPIYLIMAYPKSSTVTDADYLAYFANQSWADQLTYIGTEYGFPDDIKCIYRLR